MATILIIYLIFLIIYLIFNGYAISRIWAMRFQGDATRRAIFIYAVIVISIIALTFILFSSFYSIDYLKNIFDRSS